MYLKYSKICIMMERKADNTCISNKSDSKYAYYNGEKIYIDEYCEMKMKDNLFCINGHKLIAVKGDTKAHHFRHYVSPNVNDNQTHPLTDWHSNWQNKFDTHKREVCFPKINEHQIMHRRADIHLSEHNIVIEFQHSDITRDEVNARKCDYMLNKQDVIWIIDGNNSIKVKELDTSNRCYLTFLNKSWKYTSFTDYTRIFIDIDNKIYKIYPSIIKNNMIDVEPPIDINEFVNRLNINDKWINEINTPPQCMLYIKQQGAGNGKTYGLIQQLGSKEFEHYTEFIIVTKQHSAKYVIYNEFENQCKNNKLNYLSNIQKEEVQKKYYITYTNTKTNLSCKITICTIDSVIFALGDKTNNDRINKFESLVNSVIGGYIEKRLKSFKNLNKNVCLICDETQDLSEDYAKAIIQLMRNHYIDAYIVGDQLQSLMFEKNAFTYFMDNEVSYIMKIIFEKSNVCRRFQHPALIKFVNTVIPFNKWNLPEIECKSSEDFNCASDNNPVSEFFGIPIYEFRNYAKKEDKELTNVIEHNEINNEIKNIMSRYDYEVNKNNYKPNDFLFITPFTKDNAFVNALESVIHDYWVKRFNNTTTDFIRYAKFHKSELGKSINLAESDNATRLVSIHTSKGDGRNVVFLIGINENSLKRFSKANDTLLYDSLLHVALTRMKTKIYIRLDNNVDDFYQKIKSYVNLTNEKLIYNSFISLPKHKIKYNNDIVNYIKDNNADYILLKSTILKDRRDFDSSNDRHKYKDKKTIDIEHHYIRYSSMLIHLYITIIQQYDRNKKVKNQTLAVILDLNKKDIIDVDSIEEYNYNLQCKNIVLCKFTNKNTVSNNNYETLKLYMMHIKRNLKKIINRPTELCPLECIVLYYMLQISRNGVYTKISLMDLYDIINAYSKSFNVIINQNSLLGHNHCMCKEEFSKVNHVNEHNDSSSIYTYLTTHYDDIRHMTLLYNKLISTYNNVSWLIDHPIHLSNVNNTNDNLLITRRFELIGYDTDNVYIIYIKPNINTLNYTQILIDSIFDTFLIHNIKQHPKSLPNYDKFGGKQVKTILFALNLKNYEILDWNNSIGNYRSTLIDLIKTKILDKYSINIKCIYNIYKEYYNDAYLYNKLDPNQIIRLVNNRLIPFNSVTEDDIPYFISNFLNNIRNEVKKCRNNMDNIQIVLTRYINEEYFTENLKNDLVNSIEDILDNN